MVLAFISAFMPAATDDLNKILSYHFPNLFTPKQEVSTLDVFVYVRPALYFSTFFLTALFGYRWELSNRNSNEAKQKDLDSKLLAHANKLAEQNEKSELLIKFLHTMPPKFFLSRFDKTFSFVSSLKHRIQTITATHPKTEDAQETVANACQAQIRAMNILLSELTGLWDAQGDGELPDVQYSVNVMFYYDADEALEKFTSGSFSWEDSKKFFLATSPDGIKTDVDGVLFTEPTLSTKAINSDLKAVISSLKSELQIKHPQILNPRQDTRPFGLPVTLHNGRFRDQNIPGAPRCYAQKEPQYISCCVEEMSKEIEGMKDIPSSMKDELSAYYKQHKSIQSIVSFPLISPDGHAYGVLNISRSKKHLAKRNELDFISLTKPIVSLISDSIYALIIYKLMPTQQKEEV